MVPVRPTGPVALALSQFLQQPLRSQTLAGTAAAMKFDKIGVITPGCKFWLMRRKRFLAPLERAGLQGMNNAAQVLSMDREVVCDLAGNAYNIVRAQHAIIAQFAAGLLKRRLLLSIVSVRSSDYDGRRLLIMIINCTQ